MCATLRTYPDRDVNIVTAHFITLSRFDGVNKTGLWKLSVFQI